MSQGKKKMSQEEMKEQYEHACHYRDAADMLFNGVNLKYARRMTRDPNEFLPAVKCLTSGDLGYDWYKEAEKEYEANYASKYEPREERTQKIMRRRHEYADQKGFPFPKK